MTTRQYKRALKLLDALNALRLDMDRNDPAREYVFRAQDILHECICNTVPQKALT